MKNEFSNVQTEACKSQPSRTVENGNDKVLHEIF